MSIKARKLKDGTTVYDAVLEYGTVDGKRDRRKRTFSTLREARKADADAARIRRAGRHLGRLTLGEYIERFYWPIASRRLQATSLDTYRKEIDKRLIPKLGDVFLDELDRQTIQRMVDSCATEDVARKALQLLKTILNEAVADGFAQSNAACAKCALPAKGRPRDNGVILPDWPRIRDFAAVVMEDAPVQVKRLLMSGLGLGLRPEERYALDWEDFSKGTVRVKGAYVVASSAHGGVQMKGTKTRFSDRLIPMSPFFAEYWVTQAPSKGPWIVNRKGERLSPSTGRHMWEKFLREHPDLPRVTLENMRHSFATACLQSGMNVEDLSRMLGHSDINTTYRRYVKPDMENMLRGLRKTSVT